MQRDDPTVVQYFRDQLDPVSADKRGIVIPRTSLRRKVILLDNILTEQQFRVEGDFVYFDQNSTGVATVKLNNTSEDPWPAVALAGVSDVPYTDIFISGAAQAGKFLNMWYGYRARFMNPQQSIATIGSITSPVRVNTADANNTGINAVTVNGSIAIGQGMGAVLAREVGFAYGASFKSVTNLVTNATEQVFSAAANPNGALLWDANIVSVAAAGQSTTISLHAHTGAPVVYTDGDVQLQHLNWNATLAGLLSSTPSILTRARFIPAGKGLWFLNIGNNEVTARRNVLYTLL